MREWTVLELITALRFMPLDAKVTLIDDDTGWTIPMFKVANIDGGVVILPCNHSEMITAKQWAPR